MTIRRRATSSGWTELTVVAPLGEATTYRDANNRIVLGDGGPDAMTSDDFSESWGGWYDNKVRPAFARALDPEQGTGTFVTRFEWTQLGIQGDRVAYAAEHYGGAWSRALKADYDAARAVCEGAPMALAAGALDFRRRGEELAAEVRAKGQAAWVAAKASVAPDTIPAFPAINPVRGDARPVVDKYVVLGPLGNARGLDRRQRHGGLAILQEPRRAGFGPGARRDDGARRGSGAADRQSAKKWATMSEENKRIEQIEQSASAH